FLTPCSTAARPARSAATCAANGVDLREPLNPAPPDVAHDNALPWRSVMVMIVLLNDAWMCAIPSATFFFTFLRTRAAAALFGAFAMIISLNPTDQTTRLIISSATVLLCAVPYG